MGSHGSMSKTVAPTLHPCRDDHGREVSIRRPSTASPIVQWRDPGAIAVVVPEGLMIESLNGIPFEPCPAPSEAAGWGAADGVGRPGDASDDAVLGAVSTEPPFMAPAGLAAAAGVVIREADGRVWSVAPTNGFGGYSLTFPKGRLEAGLDLRAAARKEAHEEVGLCIAITGFLIDLPRSTTFTRYYLARRIGGTPAAMGWESQAVWLVPRARLREVITHPNDRPLLDALDARCPETP
jgi:8-oxo-dGTP pyrophosphatase MutT (NUDIX family)